jgi:hypothetical protein
VQEVVTLMKGRTAAADALTPLEFATLNALAETIAHVLGVKKADAEVTLGAARALKCARGRRRARGTVAAKVQERHGSCCILTTADCDAR